jgi:AAA15 family ATPase/GTPase
MGFIKKIEIENFYSIKNAISLDLESSEYMIKNHSDRVIKSKNENYSILNAIYGANASGKSSILRAIIAVSQVISNSSDERLPISFKNKFNSKKTLSKINLNFIVNEKEYLYELTFKSVDFKNIGIRNEILYLIDNDKTLLFDRSKKIIKNIENNIKESIFNKLNDKKSLIYEFYKFDKTNEFEIILNFFKIIKYTTNITNAYITETAPSKNRIEKLLEHFMQEEIFGLKDFIINFLNSIGLDIVNLIPTYKLDDDGNKLFDSLFIKHKISKSKELEFVLESDGTMNLVQILINVFIVKMNKSVLVIDEFDSILHPMLVPLLNKLLLDNKIQVIYTTHNIYNMKYLYHDEITIIEKDSEHLTYVKELKKFDNIDFTDNILDLYEEGTFGGIPDINSIYTKINNYE